MRGTSSTSSKVSAFWMTRMGNDASIQKSIIPGALTPAKPGLPACLGLTLQRILGKVS